MRIKSASRSIGRPHEEVAVMNDVCGNRRDPVHCRDEALLPQGAGARVQVDQPVDRLGYKYFIQPIQRIMTDGCSLWPKRGACFFAASFFSRLARHSSPMPADTVLRNWQDQSGATRTPLIPGCSIAFRTTPVFFASLTISASLA
jgi:hypothetical protein